MPFDPDVWIALLQPLAAGLPRALALMYALPLFPQQGFPAMVRTAVALALLMGAYPLLAAEVPPAGWSALQWMGFTIKEVFIGFVLGYAMGMLIWAFEAAGALIDNQVGMNNANIFDPFGGHQGGPYGSFLAQTAVILLIAVGGLPLMAGLLYESFKLWPLQSFLPDLGAPYETLAREGLQANAALTLSLAAPVLIVLVVVEIGIGLINRVAQQLNAFYFSMPIKGVIAALMLAILVSFWADALRDHITGWSRLLPAWDAAWR